MRQSFLLRLLAVGALALSATVAVPAASAAEPSTVLVTGANRGIGLELARQYAERGWKVIATARKPEEATELAAIAKAHPLVVVEKLDVTDFAQIDALAAKYASAPIDVLIHNAGISGNRDTQRFGNMDFDDFRHVLDTNAIGPLKLTEALWPSVLLGAQKKVVTISSSEGSMGMLNAARLYWYRASKATVNMLMLNLAYDVKKQGVAVALVNPGPVETDFMKGVRMPLQKPAESVGKVIGIIDRLSVETTGKFWDYDGGEVPW